MANNSKNNETGVNLGEIGTIRDILMGQHINQFEERFVEIQEQMNSLQEQLEEKIQEVDRFHKFAMIDFNKESNQRFNKVEKQLAKDVSNLEQKIRNSSTADKKEIGKLMANVAKKLIGE